MNDQIKKKYEGYLYNVNGVSNIKFATALRLWKTKHRENFEEFSQQVILHSSLEEFGQLVNTLWNDISIYEVKEAFEEKNVETRRLIFDCIGIERIFKELNPVLRDRQTVQKKRTRWNNDNKEYLHEFEDVYELYEIEKLVEAPFRQPESAFAVRCWCTTTNREYWLYVTPEAATNLRAWEREKTPDYDAIRAIAWTIRIDIKNPKRIYRQGDVILAEFSEDSTLAHIPYHLDKDQYLQLMYSET